MYEYLGLQNFKGFESQEIFLRPLTLLTGLNSTGKSSVIQSLLLLRQSYLQRAIVTGTTDLNLILNGDLIELGTGGEVFHTRLDYRPDVVELALSLGHRDIGKEITWRYAYDADGDVLSPVQASRPSNFIYETSLFTDNFHYIQAERIGPRTVFNISDHMVRQRRQLGKSGEYATHFLQIFASDSVSKEMLHKDSDSPLLRDQVVAWMSEVSPGTILTTEILERTDLIRLSVNGSRPTNVGFGITYTLPVLVSLLSATPGSLVLLENPEAHLHPKGQTQMGELIARAVQSGVQVIVETHSDHIFNAIRLAVKQQLLKHDDVQMCFFRRPRINGNLMPIDIVTPQLDSDGRLVDDWPTDFFDEFGKVLLDLL